MRKVVWGVAAVLLVLVLLRVGLSLVGRTSDQEQIQQALADSIKASKEGRPGGVYDLIGKQITFNSEDASGQLSQVGQIIKNQRPDITVENRQAVITGDDAVINSPVAIDLSLLGQHRTIRLKNVLLQFRKEASTEFLIIPSKKWKLEQVHAPDISADQFTQ